MACSHINTTHRNSVASGTGDWHTWRVHAVGRDREQMLPRIMRRLESINPQLVKIFNRNKDDTSPIRPDEALVQLLFVGATSGYISISPPLLSRYFSRILSPFPGGACPEFISHLRANIARRDGVPVDRLEGSLDELIKARLPARSYLKLAELEMRYPSFMSKSFVDGALVADLGSAPGSWTLFALERGAVVVAIDKSSVYDSRVMDYPKPPIIKVFDALLFEPPHSHPTFNLLLVDMKVPPMTTLTLLERWLSRGWCHNFIVTLKFEGKVMTTMETERFIRDSITPLCSYINSHSLDHGGKEINLFVATQRIDIRGPVHPVATPIYLSSNYVFDSASHGATLCEQKETKDGQSPWIYTRWGNPTTDVAEQLITKLEGGVQTFVTASGMAAISTTLLALLKAGDHAVATSNIYGGTHEFFSDVLPKLGVEVSWADPRDIDAFAAAIRPNTRVIYGETPANPTMVLMDLEAFGALGKARGVYTIVDSTFGSAYNQTPISYGVDVVVHSATKYYGGHSDLVAGCITVASDSLSHKIGHYVRLMGCTPAPQTSYLLQRGLKTLALRMSRHNENAMAIARHLIAHPKVAAVHYPGLESHPQHELAKKQMKRGYGGMIAFEVKGGADGGRQVIESLQIITLAVSLGGVESLIEQASTMTHTMVPREERERVGITDGLLRLSVGCENVDDLIADLNNALSKIQ
eukprot:gene1181-1358_t